jgi:hypothetical protein
MDTEDILLVVVVFVLVLMAAYGITVPILSSLGT